MLGLPSSLSRARSARSSANRSALRHARRVTRASHGGAHFVRRALRPCSAPRRGPRARSPSRRSGARSPPRFAASSTRSAPNLGVPLGHLLRRLLREEGLSADVVVPVPLHPKRLAERGYNQAALLARAAARELGAPLAARALVRVRDTSQQARLGRTERLANVERAFVARDPKAVRGRDVLLVDDVETTGATLTACRAALLEAGARRVTMVCLSRAGTD